MATKSAVGKAVNTKAKFAEQLSSFTTLTADEIKMLFPNKSDRTELLELIAIVNSSANENKKKAKLIQDISKVSGAVIKLGKRFAPGL